MQIHNNLKNLSDVCIVDESYLPACFFLSNYMETAFADRAFSTRYTYAKTLLFIYRYFTDQSIDLVERVESGKFLTAEEYDDFKRHCKYKVEADFENDKSNVVSFERFSDKQLDNLIHASQSTESRASAFTIKERLRLFFGYIEDLYNVFHFANNADKSVRDDFADLELKVKTDIRALKDENTDVSDPFDQAIPDEVFFKILEIIKPASPKNPWTQQVRLRNQLIVDTFIEAGIREGALAGLKISDIKHDHDKPRLLITRTPNDPTDTRKIPAAQKTKAHSSAISHGTMKLLKLYIETERSKYPKAKTHDFIFVSEKGNTRGEPLKLGSINKIIDVLSHAVDFKLHPHLFRHKWNEIFEKRARKAGLTPEQIEDIRKYAMGWVEDSKMSGTYNSFMHAMLVHELSTQRQNESLPAQGESNGDN
ncbi:site-specific integrase [Photobacterium proteolyticum]|uniref:site-specific integrase n=1 Tax=Photobacterium proteolyticum TaxID=1903952 RepID=UPI0015881486|nr:site-specific integrase [Photobacterium proteolyticum]